jgi:tetratricopeptide (TPR) repeat protein
MLAAMVAACGCERAAAPPRVLLDQDVPVSELSAPKRFSISDPTPGYRLVEIDQTNVDVKLTQFADRQRQEFNAPARRDAPERGCTFTRGGTLELIVSSKDPLTRAPNKFHIRVTAVDAPRPAPKGSRLAIECLEAAAGTYHKNWAHFDPVAQSRQYAAAAEGWRELGDARRAAWAQHQAAWMITRLRPSGDANIARAIELGERAEADFRALHDCVGTAHSARQLSVPRAIVAKDVAKGRRAATTSAATQFALIKRELGEGFDCYEAAGLKYFAAESLNALGSVSFYSDDIGAATSQLAESIARFRAIDEPEGERRPRVNASIVRGALGEWRDAVKGFDEVAESGQVTAEDSEDGDDAEDAEGGQTTADDAVVADIFDSSATAHIAVGNYDKALRELLQSSVIHEKAGDVRGLAESLNTFATAYLSIGDADAARQYAQRAVSVRERLSADDRTAAENEQIVSLLLQGNAERQLANLPAAVAAHETALKLTHADRLGVQARLELARDALRLNRPAEAQRLLGEASARVHGSWGTLAPQIELERARAYSSAGDIESARNGLEKLRGRFEAAGQPALEVEVLQQLAAAELASGRYDDARRSSDDCLARLDALRLATVNPMFRAGLIATHRAAYELKVEMLLKARERAAAHDVQRTMLTEILAASDTARAGLVREFATAGSAESKDVRDLAADIALQEYLLQRVEYGYTLRDGDASLRNRLSDLRARFDASAAHLPPTGGFQSKQYSWERLPAEVAVLSFVHSSAGLRRYLFTREGAQELPVVPLAPVDAAFGGLRREITSPVAGTETAALASLSKLLLGDAPALAAKRRWVVVADATTSEVPFAALSLDPKNARPLILDHELSLALTTRDALDLARGTTTAQRPSLARVAIFADPVFSPVDTRVANKQTSKSRMFVPTPRLAATAHEADTIAKQLPHVDVKVFAGFDATRDAVLSPYVNAATVLHFATHASSSDAWPHGSGLMLSGVDRDGELINGYLSTLDLLMSRRATDLVVLSACDTARGESTQTENVAGLARAFLGSGARRVVGTLWAVNDAATAELMGGFYQRLARGDSAASALREAQAQMAAAGRFRPAAWAAFVLYESVRRP